MTLLHELKARINRLDAQGFEPTTALMTPQTWAALQTQFISEMGWSDIRRPSGGEVLGITVDLSSHRSSVVILCKGMIDAVALGNDDPNVASQMDDSGSAKAAEPTFRLIYASLVSPGERSNLGGVMRDILAVSNSLNRRDGISGMLVSDGETFVQILEGPERLVEDCFSRIQRDPRNSAPVVRLRETGPDRLFSRWSMCGVTLSRVDDALLSQGDIRSDVFNVAPGWLLQMLRTLAERHGQELDAVHEEYASVSN